MHSSNLLFRILAFSRKIFTSYARIYNRREWNIILPNTKQIACMIHSRFGWSWFILHSLAFIRAIFPLILVATPSVCHPSAFINKQRRFGMHVKDVQCAEYLGKNLEYE